MYQLFLHQKREVNKSTVVVGGDQGAYYSYSTHQFHVLENMFNYVCLL